MTTNLPSQPLSGRVAVVTGATSGIGAATARRLVEDGAVVAVLGRRGDRLQQLAEGIGGNTIPVAVDVMDRVAVERVAEFIRGRLGRVDLVVAIAGVRLPSPYEAAEVTEWDSMIATNINGLLYTSRAFVDDLVAAAAEGRSSDLVYVGSIGAHTIFPDYSVYDATQAAVAHLSRNLRAEFGPRGVRVKMIEPGFVASELGDGMLDDGLREQLPQWRSDLKPLRKEDIANVIAYAVAAPPQMNIAQVVVVPTQQG